MGHQGAGDGVLHPGQVRVMVHHAGSQQHRASGDRLITKPRDETVAALLQCFHEDRLNLRPVFLRLKAHAGQYGVAADALRKARHVVADRNPGCARLAAVGHEHRAPEPRQIGRRRQARRARADDENIDLLHCAAAR